MGGKSPVSEGVCLLTAVPEQLETRVAEKSCFDQSITPASFGMNVWTATLISSSIFLCCERGEGQDNSKGVTESMCKH